MKIQRIWQPYSTTLEDEIRNINSNDESTADNILGIVYIDYLGME